MKQLKKEIPFLVLALLPFVYLAFIWKQLPDLVPMHWNIEGEIDRWGSKKELITMLVLLSGLNYFIFLVIPYIDPKQKLQNMGNKFKHLRFVITLFMTALAIGIIHSTQEKTSKMTFVFILVGLLIAFLGNYFKTIKPNYFIGIRTPWTLENEVVWKKTHVLGGQLWFVGGILMALTFLLPKDFQFYTFIGITIVICIIPFVYSYLEFQKQKN